MQLKLKHLGDLHDSNDLPDHRYRRVKYEDLVSDPEGTMRELYTFAGIPITSEMLISVNQHFNAELLNKTEYASDTIFKALHKNIFYRDYYSVFRRSSYVANNTQLKTLPSSVKSELQTWCHKVMESLEYDL